MTHRFASFADWNVADCSIVILAGQALCVPAFILLCSLSDDHSAKNIEDDDDGVVGERESQVRR